jgi:hypothetical protein
MSPPSTESPAIGAWMQVLDEIQRKLGEALAFDPEASIPVFPAVAELGSPLEPLDERLGKLQACLDRAEADAAQIDAGLQQEAEATQHHLDNLRAARRKLADWASRAV